MLVNDRKIVSSFIYENVIIDIFKIEMYLCRCLEAEGSREHVHEKGLFTL